MRNWDHSARREVLLHTVSKVQRWTACHIMLVFVDLVDLKSQIHKTSRAQTIADKIQGKSAIFWGSQTNIIDEELVGCPLPVIPATNRSRSVPYNNWAPQVSNMELSTNCYTIRIILCRPFSSIFNQCILCRPPIGSFLRKYGFSQIFQSFFLKKNSQFTPFCQDYLDVRSFVSAGFPLHAESKEYLN